MKLKGPKGGGEIDQTLLQQQQAPAKPGKATTSTVHGKGVHRTNKTKHVGQIHHDGIDEPHEPVTSNGLYGHVQAGLYSLGDRLYGTATITFNGAPVDSTISDLLAPSFAKLLNIGPKEAKQFAADLQIVLGG